LPPGEYIIYVQFSGNGPVPGLRNISFSSYATQRCAPVHNAPCALISTVVKDPKTAKDSGLLEDTHPIRDPTEKPEPIPVKDKGK